MPRGQDAPIRKGGQLDPYVASSIQRGRGTMENRLVAAMQEKGATERAGIAAGAQLSAQKMRSETALRTQAASEAGADRRAAEAERGRREDREFAKVEAEANREFEVKRDESRRLFEKSLIEGNREETREARQMMLDVQQQQLQTILESEENRTNAVVSMIKGMGQQELAKEKFETLSAEEVDKADMIEDAHNTLVERTTRRFLLDRGSDISPSGLGGVVPIRGILQTQLNESKVNIKAEDLIFSRIHNIKDQLKEGKIVPEDLRTTLGVIDGIAAGIKQRTKDATNPNEIRFWELQDDLYFDMRDSLIGLLQDKDPIPDSQGQTVGSKMRDALGPVLGFSQGQRMKQRKSLLTEAEVRTPFALMEDYTKSIDPYKPREYPINASAFTKELIDRRNAAYEAASRKTSPDIGPEEQSSLWGAD